MSGLFTGHVFNGMGDGEETTAAESPPGKILTGMEKGGTISPMDTLPMSQTMAPAPSSSPSWLPWALIGGGVVVSGVLIMMATSGGRVAANRRRRRGRRR